MSVGYNVVYEPRKTSLFNHGEPDSDNAGIELLFKHELRTNYDELIL